MFLLPFASVLIMVEFQCCPNCKRILSQKDFVNVAIMGALDSVLPTFMCINCGYQGLPVLLSEKDYELWVKESQL